MIQFLIPSQELSDILLLVLKKNLKLLAIFFFRNHLNHLSHYDHNNIGGVGGWASKA